MVDDLYEEHFNDSGGAESVHEQCLAIASVTSAGDIKVIDENRRDDGGLDFDRTLILKSEWIKWCRKIGKENFADFFEHKKAWKQGASAEEPEHADWHEKAKAIANRIGLQQWGVGQRNISARNICAAVAAELAMDAATHGIQGQRGEDNVRNEGLRGWEFMPPRDGQAMD
jgi:hypothetical protein